MRNMSPQAYRRLRGAMTEGELRDLARDIALALPEATTGATNRIFDVLAQASPYTKLAAGVRVRVLDSYVGTHQELRGKIESGDADGWLVRSPNGELAGPYDDSELERTQG